MPLIAANGTELFYDLGGAEGAPVVVFSNSIGTTLEMWDPQARALAGRYRVLRYDTRGHGRSPVKPGAIGVETLADDLAGLLDALGIGRAHVVGLSLGGMTAQALAVRRPALVHGLVLMATAAHLPGNWVERAAAVRAQGMGAIVDAVIGRWFTPGFRADPQVAALAARFVANPAEGYAICCGAIEAMDLRPGNAAIAAPTLIVAGAEDPATPPAMAEDIRSRVKQAELVVLPRAAHILNIERAGPGEPASAGVPRWVRHGAGGGECGVRGRVGEPEGGAGGGACAAVDGGCRGVCRAVAGLHHADGLGGDLGGQDHPVEDAVDDDAGDHGRAGAGGGVQAACAAGAAERGEPGGAAVVVGAVRGLCRGAGGQRGVPMDEGGAGGRVGGLTGRALPG